MNKIELLGFLPDKKAADTIKTSKIFLCPSHEEGFGLAPLEAQTMGLPVVAWDLPVFAEIFPKGMIKIPMGDTKRFADAIIRLLNDHDYCHQLSKEAAENARRFSWDKTAKNESRILMSFWKPRRGGADRIFKMLSSRLNRGSSMTTLLCKNQK